MSIRADVGRHHRVHTAEGLVVAVAHFQGGEGRKGLPRRLRRIGQEHGVHRLHVALDGLGAKWHGAVDGHQHLRRPAGAQVGAEFRRDLDGEGDGVGFQPPVEVLRVGERRLDDEIGE